MGYWREIADAAHGKALKDAKLDSAVSAVISLLVQAATAVLIYALAGFTPASEMTRVIVAITPFLTYPLAFGVHFALEPKAHFEATCRELELIRNPKRPPDYETSVFQNGVAVGRVVGKVEDRGNKVRLYFDEIEDFVWDPFSAFVYKDDIVFFLRAESQTVLLVSQGYTRHNVWRKVETLRVGNLGTVARASPA